MGKPRLQPQPQTYEEIIQSMLDGLKDGIFVFRHFGWYSPFELMHKYGANLSALRGEVQDYRKLWFFQRWWRALRYLGQDDIALKQRALKYWHTLDLIARAIKVIKWDHESKSYVFNIEGFRQSKRDSIKNTVDDHTWLKSIGFYDLPRKIAQAFKQLKEWLSNKVNWDSIPPDPPPPPVVDLTQLFNNAETNVNSATDEKSADSPVENKPAPTQASKPQKAQDYCVILLPPHMRSKKVTHSPNMIVLERKSDEIRVVFFNQKKDKFDFENLPLTIHNIDQMQFPQDKPLRLTYADNAQLINSLIETCDCMRPPDPFARYFYICGVLNRDPTQSAALGKRGDFTKDIHPDSSLYSDIRGEVPQDDENRIRFLEEANRAFKQVSQAYDELNTLMTESQGYFNQCLEEAKSRNTPYDKNVDWQDGASDRAKSSREYLVTKHAECLKKAREHIQGLEKDRQFAQKVQALLSQEKQTRATEQHSQIVEELQQHFGQLEKMYSFGNIDRLPEYDRPDPTLVQAYAAIKLFMTVSAETPSPKGSVSSDSSASPRKVPNPLMAAVSQVFVISNPSSTEVSPRSPEEKTGADLSSANTAGLAEIIVGGPST